MHTSTVWGLKEIRSKFEASKFKRMILRVLLVLLYIPKSFANKINLDNCVTQSNYFTDLFHHCCRFCEGSGATWLLGSRSRDHAVPPVCQGVQLQRVQTPLPRLWAGGVWWLLSSEPHRALSWLGPSGEGVRCLCHSVRLPVTDKLKLSRSEKQRGVTDCALRFLAFFRCSTLASFLKALT